MKKQIVIIGVGGIGCEAANAFAEKYSAVADFLPLLFDTDENTVRQASGSAFFSLTSDESFGAVVARLGDRISRWFPAGGATAAASSFGAEWGMNRGSGSFRMKAMVALADFLSGERRQELEDALKKIPENSECTVLSVASVAGGTGSALLLPLSLYVARALAERGIGAEFCALLSLPGALPFMGTEVQKTKSEGNAYAALRELNAVVTGIGKDAGITIGTAKDPIFGALYPMKTDAYAGGRLFNRVYLAGKTPGILRREEHTGLLCELLFALSVGTLPTAPPPAGETPFATASAFCLSLPEREIGRYFTLRSMTEYTEELAGAFRHAREFSETEKEFLIVENKKNRKAKKIAEPVEENRYFTEICTAAGELSVPEIPPKTETISEKLRQGSCIHRFGDRKKTAEAKKTEFAALVKEWSGAQNGYAEDSAKALIEAVLALRTKWRTPGTAESLFGKIGFDGRVGTAAYTALCTLSEELEKHLLSRNVDPRYAMQTGEKPLDYLRKIAFLPLPEKCLPWFEVPARAKDITGKTCRALSELIAAGCPAIARVYDERRRIAALMLLREDIRRLTGIFDRCMATADTAARELADDACMRSGSRAFGFTAFAGDDLAQKEALYGQYGARMRALCTSLPAEITDRLQNAFAAELNREETCSGLAFDAAVNEWITEMHRHLLASFRESDAFRALQKSGLFGLLYEKDKTAFAALLAQTAGRAEPVAAYTAPNPESPPRRCKCLLIPAGAAEMLSAAGENPDRRAARAEGIAEPENAEESATNTPKPENAENSATDTAQSATDAQTAGGQDAGRAMRKLLILGQCLDAEFAFCDVLSPFRILAVGYTENLTLSGLAVLRENAKGENWYAEYCKCGFFSRKYATLAWLPELFPGRRAALPYLDAATEEKRLADTARAFLYLFIRDDLTSRKNDEGENILCAVWAGDTVPLTADGTPVIAGDFDLMWQYLAENEWLTNTGAVEFDKWLDGIRRSLPQLDEDSVSAQGFAAAVGRTPLMRMLGKGIRLNTLPMTLAETLNARSAGRALRGSSFVRVIGALADSIFALYHCPGEVMTPELTASLAARGTAELGEKLEKPLVLRLKKRIAEKTAG